MEEWKQITEQNETRYIKERWISNFGRIKNINQKGIERIIDYVPNRQGYKNVRIGKKKIDVHILMGKYWIHNPNPLINIVIDHIDRNTLNNHYTNLRWTTYSGNQYNRDEYTHKNKTGCICKNGNKYIFSHYINKVIGKTISA